MSEAHQLKKLRKNGFQNNIKALTSKFEYSVISVDFDPFMDPFMLVDNTDNMMWPNELL